LKTKCCISEDKINSQDWQRQNKSLWIVKPPAKARGNGIKVISKWNQIPKTRPILVQRYISKPYLINQTKFDLRLYVLLTSIHPLRIYLYNDGLVRFASKPYSSDSSTAHDVFTHLTNYSINNKSNTYKSNQDSLQAQGHKWTLQALWRYFQEAGVDYTPVWTRITDLVIKTIVSAEKPLRSLFQQNAKNRYSCFELFGFDILLDADLKPWLMEVNISPSMHSSTQLDHDVKSPLVTEVLNLARYHLPTRITNTHHNDTMCSDTNLYTKELSTQDRIRHLVFTQVLWRSIYENLAPPEGILDSLSSDDCRYLVVSEDELAISKDFQRIFPTNITYQYLKYLPCPGYYNLLLHAWEQRYCERREEGRLVLDRLCKADYHLQIGGRDQETPDSLLAVPDQILETCDNNYLSTRKQGHTQTSTVPNKIITDHSKTRNGFHKTNNDHDKTSNNLDKTSNDLEKISNDLDKAYIDLDKTSKDPNNRRTPQDKTRIASGKKFKTVVVKHFNVKTVSPGASR